MNIYSLSTVIMRGKNKLVGAPLVGTLKNHFPSANFPSFVEKSKMKNDPAREYNLPNGDDDARKKEEKRKSANLLLLLDIINF